MKRGHLCRSHVGHQCDEISQLSEPRNEVGPVLRHSTSAVIEAKPTTKLRLCVPLSAICFGAASIFVQSPNRHSANATPNHGGGVTGREKSRFREAADGFVAQRQDAKQIRPRIKWKLAAKHFRNVGQNIQWMRALLHNSNNNNRPSGNKALQ